MSDKRDGFDLFEPPIPSDPRETSVEAAEKVTPTFNERTQRVLAAIRASGEYGLCDHEIQDRLGMDGNSERPCRWALVNAGLVVDSGRRRWTRNNCRAIAWVAVSEVTREVR